MADIHPKAQALYNRLMRSGAPTPGQDKPVPGPGMTTEKTGGRGEDMKDGSDLAPDDIADDATKHAHIPESDTSSAGIDGAYDGMGAGPAHALNNQQDPKSHANNPSKFAGTKSGSPAQAFHEAISNEIATAHPGSMRDKVLIGIKSMNEKVKASPDKEVKMKDPTY
jgi:hypothetical protein